MKNKKYKLLRIICVSRKNKNIKIYFVAHSDICPYNSFFLKHIDKIDKIICVSEYIANKIGTKAFVLDNYVKLNKKNTIPI